MLNKSCPLSVVLPDIVPAKSTDVVSLEKFKEALLNTPRVNVYISERLIAFKNQPAAMLLNVTRLDTAPREEQLLYALAASIHDHEFTVLVQDESNSFRLLHGSVSSGTHPDVNLIASISSGALCAYRPCFTKLVASGAPLFVWTADAGKLCDDLIASPARVRGLARRFVAQTKGVGTRKAVDVFIRNHLPHAKAADIEAAWKSCVPEEWHHAGRRRSRR